MTPTDIYEVCSGGMMLLLMILVYRYIYMEPGLVSRRNNGLFAVGFLLAAFGVKLFLRRTEPAEILIPLVFFCLYVLLTRRKRRIRGMFLLLPISGYLFMLVAASTSFYCVITGVDHSDGLFTYAMDMVCCLALLVFWLRGGRFRRRADSEQEYRRLDRGERWLLNLGGLFLFVMAVILIAVAENMEGYALDGGWRVMFLLTGSISISLLAVAVIAFVMQGSRKEYYQREAKLTEKYLRAELEHFKAYREAQREVRRVRHDMKNHYAVLSVLADEGKYAELREYLAQLGEELARSDVGIRCGNDIADAILNEKNARAEKSGAVIEVEGRLPQDCGIDVLDICTIFSNALDNALEYLEGAQPAEKWIRIRISGQGNMWLFQFENPVMEDAKILPVGKTGKDRMAGADRTFRKKGSEHTAGAVRQNDDGWHGFGIMNMERTAEKYAGNLSREIKEGVYSLEVVLFTTKEEGFTTKSACEKER